MMMDESVKCPGCRVTFSITWPVGYDIPEYCPFCGCEMNYRDEET